MTEHMSPIPSRVYNAAVGGHVCGSVDIIDDDLGLEQNAINKEVAGTVPYDQANPNGMGRVILKKNDNFKTVVEAQTNGNTIFVIKYDFTLTGNVTIPANCVLEFDGGSISAGSDENMDTITGVHTRIKADLHVIFDDYIKFAGTWDIQELYAYWFGVVPTNINDDTSDISPKVNRVIEAVKQMNPRVYYSRTNGSGGIRINFIAGVYNAKTSINYGTGTLEEWAFGLTFSGDSKGGTLIVNRVHGDYFFKKSSQGWGLIFENFTIQSSPDANVFHLYCPYDCIVRNCNFYGGNEIYHGELTCVTYIEHCFFMSNVKPFVIMGNMGQGANTDVFIKECWFQWCGTAIYVNRINENNETYLFIENTSIEYCKKSIDMVYGRARLTNVAFEGNGNPDAGVDVESVTKGTFTETDVILDNCDITSGDSGFTYTQLGTSAISIINSRLKLSYILSKVYVQFSGNRRPAIIRNIFGEYWDGLNGKCLIKAKAIVDAKIPYLGDNLHVKYNNFATNKFYEGIVWRDSVYYYERENIRGNISLGVGNQVMYFEDYSSESVEYNNDAYIEIEAIADNTNRS